MKRYLLFLLSALLIAGGADAAKKKTTTKAKAKAKVEKVSAADLLRTIREKCAAYDFDNAMADLEKYRDHADANEALADSIESRLSMGKSMLERVEKIVVIDSITVDKEQFFKAYNIDPSVGSINSAETLPRGFVSATATTVYMPERGNRILWGAPANGGKGTRIMESALLNDGSWETPEPLDEAINQAGVQNVNYPFVLPDGITLYYASDNPETSLGGYDIYVSRFDGERYLEPQNIGMPFNSTADDYLMAIDEVTGTGWWATDRNHIPGKLTIYVYIPTELRVNYPADTPALADLAKLTSVTATQPKGANYSELLEKIRRPMQAVKEQAHDFEFAMPDGSVIRSLSQLRDAAARRAMEAYLERVDDLNEILTNLSRLRSQYAAGNSEVASEIAELENRELAARTDLRRLKNQAATTYLRTK